MARRKKNMSLEEERDFLDGQIAQTESNLKELKARRKEVEKMLDQENVSKLMDVVKESGKSIEEIMEMLKN